MILVISNMYPSKDAPNYGVFVKNFVDELEKKEKVELITFTKKYSVVSKILAYLLFYLKILFRYIVGSHSLVYVHYAGYNAPPVILGRLFRKRKKLIVNVHGSDVTPEKKFEQFTNFFTGILLKKADLTIVPSSYFSRVVVEKYGTVKTFVSPSAGVNLDLFTEHMRERKADTLTLGYVSRIDPEKGWDLLLNAISDLRSSLPNMRVIIVGSGSQNEELNERISSLSLRSNVTRFEMLPQEKLAAIYSELDVFVFPSYRAGESLGLVGLEAMACGIPVIGSDFGGISTYLIDSYNGLLFKPQSLRSLKEAILKFSQLSTSEIDFLKKNALKTAQKYDSKVVTEDLIKKIESVMVN